MAHTKIFIVAALGLTLLGPFVLASSDYTFHETYNPGPGVPTSYTAKTWQFSAAAQSAISASVTYTTTATGPRSVALELAGADDQGCVLDPGGDSVNPDCVTAAAFRTPASCSAEAGTLSADGPLSLVHTAGVGGAYFVILAFRTSTVGTYTYTLHISVDGQDPGVTALGSTSTTDATGACSALPAGTKVPGVPTPPQTGNYDATGCGRDLLIPSPRTTLPIIDASGGPAVGPLGTRGPTTPGGFSDPSHHPLQTVIVAPCVQGPVGAGHATLTFQDVVSPVIPFEVHVYLGLQGWYVIHDQCAVSGQGITVNWPTDPLELGDPRLVIVTNPPDEGIQACTYEGVATSGTVTATFS